MPALSVSVDGQELATVNTSGLTMLAFHLFGNRSNAELALLDMNGGCYGAEKKSHLIWISNRRLEAGQAVVVSLVADAPTSHAGKTIDQLFPDEAPCEKTDFTPSAAMFDELRKREMLRDGYAFSLASPAGPLYAGRTEGEEDQFGLNVVWTALHRPDSARFSLGTTTLENVRTRSPSRQHVHDWLRIGDSLRFEVWPSAAQEPG